MTGTTGGETSEKLTLLIANYNNGRYLRQCVTSLQWQTCPDWLALIIDDGSDDCSGDVYPDLESDPRIRVLRNRRNRGYVASLKRLIDEAETDIVGILDPEDELDVTCIEKVLKRYRDMPDAGFVYTNFIYCDQGMVRRRNGYCRPLPDGSTSLEVNCVGAFRTFRRSTYRKTAGLDEAMLYAEDKDLILKLEEVARPVCVDEPLYYYRVLPDSQSHGARRAVSKRNYLEARLRAYERRGMGPVTAFRREFADMMRMRVPTGIFDRWYGKLREYRHARRKERREKRRKTSIARRQRMGMDRNAALGNIIDAGEIMEALGMRSWLTDGTLLGMYRDGDFIRHDLDTDMGAFIDEFDPRMITNFVDRGWTLEHVFGRTDAGLEISFMKRGVKLDVFFFYREDGRLWHGAWLPATKSRGMRLVKYYYRPFELRRTGFLGRICTIPADPLAYILTKYGEGWNKPVKDWDWALSPANAVLTDFYL